MAKQSTSRLKINPALGSLPVLQWLQPCQLAVDRTYQRSTTAGDSQQLIRRIAQHWNWDLCQPLVVARRRTTDGDAWFVIDGQHRLEAARLREDIAQLPCVVGEYASAADEARAFVELNQLRRPLRKLDLFRSAVASGDKEACAILSALNEVGLSIAPHTNHTTWKPGQVSNISGIEQAWRRKGEAATRCALRALSEAFGGEVLQYAGSIFPGIAAVCFDEVTRSGSFAGDRFEKFQTMLVLRTQRQWRVEIHRVKADDPDLSYGAASEAALRSAWDRAAAEPPARPRPAPTPKILPAATTRPAAKAQARTWCEQCERNVVPNEALACQSRWCALKAKA